MTHLGIKKMLMIDITHLLGGLRRARLPEGIQRVIVFYLKNFRNNSRLVVHLGGVVFILSQATSRKISEFLLREKEASFWQIMRLIAKDIFLVRDSPVKVQKAFLFKIDHYGLKYKRYLAKLERQEIALVVMIHDLIPLENPEYCSAKSQAKFSRNLQIILRYAKGIITVSQATTQSLLTYLRNATHQHSPPIISALLASGLPNSSSWGERPVAEPYFVIVGRIDPRKNHLLLLRLWRILTERLGENTPKLIILGRRGRLCEQTQILLASRDLQDVVIEHQVNDQSLINYLYHSQALLFPSFAEGYGLPLAEALTLGVPVIASNLEVFREIGGQVPDYIDPLDTRQWLEYIEDYAKKDSSLRSAQLERLHAFKAPSWEEHFAKIERFLETL
ncbi:putative glycosyl transferase [Legionella brunensis]|uniref:Putative glycosyl transferase n=2 Tax=Legionella brunensis TaxID=29422 RepID=A0A0W0SNF9_9GAMM|nr:putative glycosyl transferase [Legionella brunensis]